MMTPQEKARWSRIKRVYGLTKDEYDALDLGHCPICLRIWSTTVRPVVDHDHSTRYVRGILCAYCNHRIVGRHRDHELLYRVGDYLRKQPLAQLVPPKKKKKKKNAKRNRQTPE